MNDEIITALTQLILAYLRLERDYEALGNKCYDLEQQLQNIANKGA